MGVVVVVRMSEFFLDSPLHRTILLGTKKVHSIVGLQILSVEKLNVFNNRYHLQVKVDLHFR